MVKPLVLFEVLSFAIVESLMPIHAKKRSQTLLK